MGEQFIPNYGCQNQKLYYKKSLVLIHFNLKLILQTCANLFHMNSRMLIGCAEESVTARECLECL